MMRTNFSKFSSCWLLISAPKGRHSPAQGNALGNHERRTDEPCKGAIGTSYAGMISPLQGCSRLDMRVPRALPWAILFRPFGASTAYPAPVERSSRSFLAVFTFMVFILGVSAAPNPGEHPTPALLPLIRVDGEGVLLNQLVEAERQLSGQQLYLRLTDYLSPE